MTAKEFLQQKYPTMRGDRWNSHEIINDEWIAQMMTEFAEQERLKGITEGFNAAREMDAVYYGGGGKPEYESKYLTPTDYLNSKNKP